MGALKAKVGGVWVQLPGGTSPAAVVPQKLLSGAYTLVLADLGCLVEIDSASAVALTVPPDTVPFPVGSIVGVRQYGVGQVTVTAGSGVTLRSRGGALKLSGQYSECSLMKRATNEWVVSGDLAL